MDSSSARVDIREEVEEMADEDAENVEDDRSLKWSTSERRER